MINLILETEWTTISRLSGLPVEVFSCYRPDLPFRSSGQIWMKVASRAAAFCTSFSKSFSSCRDAVNGSAIDMAQNSSAVEVVKSQGLCVQVLLIWGFVGFQQLIGASEWLTNSLKIVNVVVSLLQSFELETDFDSKTLGSNWLAE